MLASDASTSVRHLWHLMVLQAGLKVMRDEGEVFKCWSDRQDAIYYGELGSSRAILRAGYNLDCFIIRYQGIDWRDPTNWDCNAR